ncbi:hypothetical protein OUZ56_032834 [Daphnia magna]|uniref:RNase H type-1 domain-containing protein n=1 Tax=Daphnia magna TaxID=35525 RepID=A0ABR0B9P5_9CRUS|nr:hypothetical protein OUZ56_032834 [Daphnia magna]
MGYLCFAILIYEEFEYSGVRSAGGANICPAELHGISKALAAFYSFDPPALNIHIFSDFSAVINVINLLKPRGIDAWQKLEISSPASGQVEPKLPYTGSPAIQNRLHADPSCRFGCPVIENAQHVLIDCTM